MTKNIIAVKKFFQKKNKKGLDIYGRMWYYIIAEGQKKYFSEVNENEKIYSVCGLK